ncbi:hypothetical protein ACFPIJ_13450 [Dactylosporangium cerinum]|uniref:Uncharacterized protein n=1 Tax=Dactylosporangium cerinum TaxID=1434730 RepID=A0ABV9VTX0_9ACTN
MSTVISLNGADNVGKSTQLRWLATAVADSSMRGTIDRWHTRWVEVSEGDFSRWWFQDSSTTEHVQLVFDSHAARRKGADESVLLEDRGWPMLVAVCAATAAVKDGLPPATALHLVESLVEDLRPTLASGVHILLRHSVDPSREAALALAREAAPPSPWYAGYQRALAAILELQAARGDYPIVVVRDDRSILDIQRDVREQLIAIGVGARGLPLAALDRVWVLAGLSESGKSTVGALLRDEHGVTRLKIGYLLDVAAARAQVTDPYTAWNELEQAEHLVEELVCFSASSKASTVSLESAHRYEATRHLRRLMGGLCQVVYVHADAPAREFRAAEPLASLRRRDVIKQDRGADRIETDADWVLNNSGSLAALKLGVTTMVRLAKLPGRPMKVSAQARDCLSVWLASGTVSLVDEDTAAVVATGSANTGGWLSGWSDIDLLVIRDRYPLDRLQHAPALPPAPSEAKVAVTYVTTAEVNAGLVVPRIVHSVRQALREPERILFCRDGFEFPAFTLADDDVASRGELALVVMTLRRLLAAPSLDVRAVHKHVLLIMKILLRASDVEVDGHDGIVLAFAGLFPEALPLPSPAELLPVVRDAEAVARVVSAAGSVLDIVANLDQVLVRKVLPR